MSVVSCQLPVVSCQLSVVSCQLPVVSCWLSVLVVSVGCQCWLSVLVVSVGEGLFVDAQQLHGMGGSMTHVGRGASSFSVNGRTRGTLTPEHPTADRNAPGSNDAGHHALAGRCWQMMTRNCQPLAISHQLPSTSHQRPATNDQPPTTSHQRPATSPSCPSVSRRGLRSSRPRSCSRRG